MNTPRPTASTAVAANVLAKLIVETAQRTGLAREAGVDWRRTVRRRAAPHRCLAVRSERPHHQRRAAHLSPARPWASTIRCGEASAEAERTALLAALDGRRIAPGPAGSPTRGRRDVLPTGRNLFTADPRTLPTPTAMDLGRLAADEVLRAHLQTHGEPPRSVVIDLWGSATLRTGGEEIAQGFALMGCRPIWDHATGRVTGVEVLPNRGDRARARRCHLAHFRDCFAISFPAQIALIDAAVQAVAARDEDDDENPLAGARRAAGSTRLDRIFGTAPGTYGSGVEDLLGRDIDERGDRRGVPCGGFAQLWRRRRRRQRRARRIHAAYRRSRTFWCMRATIQRAICLKAPRMSPSSAVLRRPRRCSAARPISSCSM